MRKLDPRDKWLYSISLILSDSIDVLKVYANSLIKPYPNRNFVVVSLTIILTIELKIVSFMHFIQKLDTIQK